MASPWESHGSKLLTASGNVGIAGKPKLVYAVHIISGATAGVISLKNNGSSGTLYITGDGVISKGLTVTYGDGYFFPTDCYCTVDANTNSILVSYDEI